MTITITTKCPSKQITKFDAHERFLSKIKVNLVTQCGEWQAGIQANGYGSFPINSKKNSAHRVSYSIFKGDTSPDKVIDHICRVKNCVNPDHLREVSQKTNALENSTGVAARNKLKETCRLGHPYDQVNTRISKTKRYCRQCDELNRTVWAPARKRFKLIQDLF